MGTDRDIKGEAVNQAKSLFSWSSPEGKAEPLSGDTADGRSLKRLLKETLERCSPGVERNNFDPGILYPAKLSFK